MSLLQKLDCAESSGNISRPVCDIEPGKEIGGLVGPRAAAFTNAELANEAAFRQALIDRSVADNGLERILAVGIYQDWASSGEGRQEQTFGSGLKRLTRDATMQDDMTLVESLCYYKQVKTALHNKHNSKGYMFVREAGAKYAVFGERTKDASGNAVIKFFDLNSLYVSNYIYPTGSTVGTFTLTRGLSSPNAVDTNFGVVLLDFNPLDVITGLATAELSATSSGPTNVSVSGIVGCGTSDLADIYGADLAVVGAWDVTNAEIGTANYGNTITVASVALTGKRYVLTLAATATDPDNPGTGKKVAVKLKAPSVLAALTPAVEGVESETLIVTLG